MELFDHLTLCKQITDVNTVFLDFYKLYMNKPDLALDKLWQ